ncbi:MAG: galactokinase [Firmicutes bacterium]|nr:galactokinase [Bacillota bacterium]
MIQECIQIHKKIYSNTEKLRLFFSPGRVNLIGEHIDYNGGNVLPIAISLGNYGCIQLRSDNIIHLYSENFKDLGIVTCDLEHLEYNEEHGWANFAKGVIQYLKSLGHIINQGMDVTVDSNLPIGAGLSSSASIEALFSIMMKEVFSLNISNQELALLSQKVENKYIGLNCGIMDQFIVLNAEDKKAMLLNTHSLDYRNVEFNLGDYQLVVIDSKVARGLVGSKYNERRKECSQALEIIQKTTPVSTLCELKVDEFLPYEKELGPLLFKRAKHAVFEQARTMKAFDSLENNDILSFGKYVTQSHDSLSNDYEVSIPELDELVRLALEKGSVGSRMTGAGFGGCTINIVKKDLVSDLIEHVQIEYETKFHKIAEFYIMDASGSARELKGKNL